MPPPRPHPIVLAALAVACAFVALLILPGAVAHATSWRWPLRGPVVGAFRVTPHAPYLRGQRRGIDVAAAPGSAVRAACPGRVTFAGPLPRLGLAVSVRCGALVATYLRLGRLAVRRGALVLPGQRLGALGRSGRLRLGARRATDRRGYVDPLALLRDSGPAPPDLGPPPRQRRPRAPRQPHPRSVPSRPPPLRPRFAVPRVAAPRVAAPRVAAPRVAAPRVAAPRVAAPGVAAPRVAAPRVATPPARADPRRLPWPAYPALALIATALPVGGLARRRRGRRRSRAAAARVENA